MSPTLDGPPFCTKCGYQDTSGSDDEEDLHSHLMLYDATDFDLLDGSPSRAAQSPGYQPDAGRSQPHGPGESGGDVAATNVMPAVRPSPQPQGGPEPPGGGANAPASSTRAAPRRAAGGPRPHVPGESIFAPELGLEAGPDDKTPGKPLKVAPAEGPAAADRKRAPAAGEPGTRPLTDAGPLREEGLFLPQCKQCKRPLELEEVAGGVCRECLRDRAKRRRGVVTFRRVTQATVGTLAACEVVWIGALVLLSVARADTSGWRAPEMLTFGLRLGLVAFAAVAAVAFARDRDWGAGAAVALGPAAVFFSLLQLRSGALGGDVSGALTTGELMTAAAWLGAGATGALATLVAAACFWSTPLPGGVLLAERRRRRSGRTQGVKRSRRWPASDPRAADGEGEECVAGRRRAIAGGLVALAGAGLAGWQAVLAVLSVGGGHVGQPFLRNLALRGNVKLGSETLPSVPQDIRVISAVALSLAALAAGGVGIALLLMRGREAGRGGAPSGADGEVGSTTLSPPCGDDTHAAPAVAAAAVAGALPAWLLLGARLLNASAAGPPTTRPLAIVWGGARLLGIESLLTGTTGATPDVGLGAWAGVAALGTLAALTGALWALFGKSPARGRALAGFALAWSVVWGSGLARAVVS